MMKTAAIYALVMILLPLGCGTLGERARLERFGPTVQAYERALRLADYNKAAAYLDPSKATARTDLKPYQNIKIVEYKILHTQVSPDSQEIKQDVALQYFRLNGNIMRSTSDHQIWRYRQADKTWRLQSGLPDFSH